MAPYHSVLTHGFVVDEEGRKQSKSLGNTISPQKIWDTLGADILRLWIASTDFRSEMVASDEIFKRVADQYRRIRNTFRFLLGNINDFDAQKDSIELNNLLELDKWILSELALLQEDVIENYKSYSYHLAVQRIHNFCVNQLGGTYLDIIKDRQYTTQQLRSYFKIDFKNFEKNFGVDIKEYFSKEIEYLDGMIKDGLVIVSDDGIEMTLLGRDFSQNISNVFDKYDPPAKSYNERLATIKKAKTEQAKLQELV